MTEIKTGIFLLSDAQKRAILATGEDWQQQETPRTGGVLTPTTGAWLTRHGYVETEWRPAFGSRRLRFTRLTERGVRARSLLTRIKSERDRA